jgi:uroporphyrinogen-III synthase
MILLNTRPKNLSKKINTLCNLEKIELQNIHLSKIIPIKIDTDNGANKKIFENFNTYTNFIFTSRAAVENGTEFIKIKSALLNKNHKFFAVGDSTKEALAMKGFEAIMPIIKSSDGLVEMIEKSFPGQNLIICGENTNMNLQNKLAESADEIRCYNLNYSRNLFMISHHLKQLF